MSMGPSSPSACFTKVRISSARRTSARMAIEIPPAAAISCCTFLAPVSLWK